MIAEREIKLAYNFDNIIFKSKAMKEVYSSIEKIQDSNAPVLIRGEESVGKEHIANLIHIESAKSYKPLIKCHLSFLPKNLIENELFGSENSFFSDITTSIKSKLEQSNGGSLLLNDIADIPSVTAEKLLNYLQKSEIERIQGNKIKINTRIIALSAKNMELLLKNNEISTEFYNFITSFSIYIPPLRERREDIISLTEFFIEKYSKKLNKSVKRISDTALDIIIKYKWPGNIAELESAIEKAVRLTQDNSLHGYHLPVTVQSYLQQNNHNGDLETILNNTEKELIIDALKAGKGKISNASRILGLTERKMGLRLEKYSIDPRVYKKKNY